MGVAEDLSLLDRKLSELKFQYEQYFSGLAKTEPRPLLAEVQELIRRWNGRHITNTMHKFRYQTLVGRFNSLNGRWIRCVREMEEGTFKRDLFRVSLHEQERREREEKQKKLQDKISARGTPSEPRGASPPAGESTEALYRELLAARAASGQKDPDLTRDAFEMLLRSQRAEIRNRFDCSDVAFKVKVENGKVKLVARPVKGSSTT
jgi:hypothetical protein